MKPETKTILSSEEGFYDYCKDELDMCRVHSEPAIYGEIQTYYGCTREKGHKGKHAGHTRRNIQVATWD
jgi:hypothetical protein